ncbi:MAG: isoleucine--tRNA ligase [bacterium]
MAEKTDEFQQTLNLPKTDFPMRANLIQREPKLLDFWKDIKLHEQWKKRSAKLRATRSYILHDGPPYANGDIHVGTAVNKILKDMVVKLRNMQGYYSPYIPGWDTHGLPTEQEVIKKMGLDRKAVSPVEWRKQCKEFAALYLQRQREQFIRLGCIGDWDNPYVTYHPAYEAKEIEVLGELGEKGLLFRRKKSIHWCPVCETALADAEIEYMDHVSPSVYVAFKLNDTLEVGGKPVRASVVIWTTTPWTLPANLAIALHPDADYGLYETLRGNLIVADKLAEEFFKVMKFDPAGTKKLAVWKGHQLDGWGYLHPFLPPRPEDRVFTVLTAEYVDLTTGTGAVHTAPGHGEDDYDTGLQYNLPIVSPLSDQGKFTSEAPDFIFGMFYEEANEVIVKRLEETSALLYQGRITHSYPHCWRSKNPVIFRATPQIFLDLPKVREGLLNAVNEIQWFPDWGAERMTNMLAHRPDWCLSRQRVWGVPLPIFYCDGCGEMILDRRSVARVVELVREHGSDVWFEKEPADLLPAGYKCPACGANQFTKEKDIVDVWFDSGCSHFSVLQQHPDLQWPCSVYLEGTDQYRGWFQTSLTTSVAVTGKPPMKQIITHGFVVDEEGRKMSKSLGNVVDPQEVIRKSGAEILRVWTVWANYQEDIRCSPEILDKCGDAYRKIRNTFRFLLSNLYDFDEAICLPLPKLREIDRYALLRLYNATEAVVEAYEKYEFHNAFRAIYNYCTVDLSAFYLDVLKDRLYTMPAASNERRGAQTVLFHILDTLLRLSAPLLSFTSEEAWGHFTAKRNKPEAVFLADFPVPNEEWVNRELERRWNSFMLLRDEVNRSLENAKQQGVVRSPLEAKVTLYLDEVLEPVLSKVPPEEREEIFNTSGVDVKPLDKLGDEIILPEGRKSTLVVAVEKSSGQKCARCWKRYPSVGKDPANPKLCHRCIASSSR